jgi:hypothetical protein
MVSTNALRFQSFGKGPNFAEAGECFSILGVTPHLLEIIRRKYTGLVKLKCAEGVYCLSSSNAAALFAIELSLLLAIAQGLPRAIAVFGECGNLESIDFAHSFSCIRRISLT